MEVPGRGLRIGARVKCLFGIWEEGTVVGRVVQTITREVEGMVPGHLAPLRSRMTYWVVATDRGAVMVAREHELRCLKGGERCSA